MWMYVDNPALFFHKIEKTQALGNKALNLEALKQSSDMAIANLYHYFQETE